MSKKKTPSKAVSTIETALVVSPVTETPVTETPATVPETEINPISSEVATAEPVVAEQSKKPKRNARPYVSFAREALNQALYTRRELIAAILNAFPNLKKSAVETFVTDLKNYKYNYFMPRVVVVNEDGKLVFADMVNPIETQAAEAVVGTVEAQQEMETVANA